MDEKEAKIGPSEQLKMERNKAEEEFKEVALREEIKWRQKFRITWLWDGDNNTNFFHSFANSWKTFKQISALLINGTVCEDLEKIDEIIHFFKGLYLKKQHTATSLSSWAGKSLPPEKAAWL